SGHWSLGNLGITHLSVPYHRMQDRRHRMQHSSSDKLATIAAQPGDARPAGPGGPRRSRRSGRWHLLAWGGLTLAVLALATVAIGVLALRQHQPRLTPTPAEPLGLACGGASGRACQLTF